MLKWLQHHFIPHHTNGFKPYALRAPSASLLLLFVLFVESLYLFTTTIVLPRSNQYAAIFASVLIDQTNLIRVNEKINTLAINEALNQAAKLKVEDMASKGYFAHFSPDGKTPWYWFSQAGYDYVSAGENLAVNFTDSQEVTDAWMNSPAHRANIESGNYQEIGIATANGVDLPSCQMLS